MNWELKTRAVMKGTWRTEGFCSEALDDDEAPSMFGSSKKYLEFVASPSQSCPSNAFE